MRRDKFWSIEVTDNYFHVSYGQTGSDGITQAKSFESEYLCMKEANKLVNEKLKKGYIDQVEAEPVNALSVPEKKEPGDSDLSEDAVTLYYKDGISDKVYHASIDHSGDDYIVNFSFGRRGTALQTGTKTSSPVDYASARKIFGQLIQSKLSKGYTQGIAGTPYIQTSNEDRISGIHCQLLNPIEEDELVSFLENEEYGAQEKMDGNRLLVRKSGDQVEGINRKGLLIAISQAIYDNAISLNGDFLIDGEAIGDTYYVFDILFENGTDIREYPYKQRYDVLKNLLHDHLLAPIRLVELAKTPTDKKQLLETLQGAGKEGIVFKNLNAHYIAGRPASRGAQLKFKFYETATAKVEKVNLKRSVSMCLYETEDSWIGIGNVTIPPNFDIPEAGDLIEVRYLYAYQGGSLYQPTYLGKRADADEEDCHLKQLKYKKE